MTTTTMLDSRAIVCSRCGVDRPRSDYPIRNLNSGRRYTLCPDCRCMRPHSVDSERPRPVDIGWLCRGHYAGFVKDVAELPSLLTDLAYVLIRTARPGADKVRLSASGGWCPDGVVVKAREHIVVWLTEWAGVVARERDIRPPGNDDPNTIAAWLVDDGLGNLAWLAESPWLGECMDNLADVRAEGMRLRQVSTLRRAPCGPCPVRAEGPSLENAHPPVCGGELVAWIRDEDELLPSEVACTVDPSHRWGSAEWLRLGRRLHEQAAWA